MYQAVGTVVHPRVPHLPGGDGDNDSGGTEKEFHLGLRRIGFSVRRAMTTYQRVKLNAESSEKAPATSSIAWLS